MTAPTRDATPISNMARSRPMAAAILLALATSTQAAVVCSPEMNLDVPETTEGLYVNFVTGVSGTSEGAVPGFDLDPYAAAGTDPSGQLKFYWGSASTSGAGVVSSGDTYVVLAPGAVIGPDAVFSRAAFTGDTTAWQAGTTGYLGMRFRDEAASGLIVYGWLALSTTAPLGFPATLQGWCYEDSGAAIVIPALPSDEIFVDGFEDANRVAGARSI
jgi:hypothetical protein